MYFQGGGSCFGQLASRYVNEKWWKLIKINAKVCGLISWEQWTYFIYTSQEELMKIAISFIGYTYACFLFEDYYRSCVFSCWHTLLPEQQFNGLFKRWKTRCMAFNGMNWLISVSISDPIHYLWVISHFLYDCPGRLRKTVHISVIPLMIDIVRFVPPAWGPRSGNTFTWGGWARGGMVT